MLRVCAQGRRGGGTAMSDTHLRPCPLCFGTGITRQPLSRFPGAVRVDDGVPCAAEELEIVDVECPKCLGHRVIEEVIRGE